MDKDKKALFQALNQYYGHKTISELWFILMEFDRNAKTDSFKKFIKEYKYERAIIMDQLLMVLYILGGFFILFMLFYLSLCLLDYIGRKIDNYNNKERKKK